MGNSSGTCAEFIWEIHQAQGICSRLCRVPAAAPPPQAPSAGQCAEAELLKALGQMFTRVALWLTEKRKWEPRTQSTALMRSRNAL